MITERSKSSKVITSPTSSQISEPPMELANSLTVTSSVNDTCPESSASMNSSSDITFVTEPQARLSCEFLSYNTAPVSADIRIADFASTPSISAAALGTGTKIVSTAAATHTHAACFNRFFKLTAPFVPFDRLLYIWRRRLKYCENPFDRQNRSSLLKKRTFSAIRAENTGTTRVAFAASPHIVIAGD